MIVVFEPATQRRLDVIEAEEGVPQVDLVRQAVDLWSLLTLDERRAVGFAAIRTVMRRLRESRAKDD